MAAILCHNCRKLISQEETTCPYCGVSQRVNTGKSVRKAFFSNGQSTVSFFVGICVLMYIATVAGDIKTAGSMERGGILALGSPNQSFLWLTGMTGGFAWVDGHYWTLFTASFLHGSLLHIFFNMSWLRQLGALTTAFLGPARFALVFLITGATGFLASNLFHDPIVIGYQTLSNATGVIREIPLYGPVPTVGASCSIFGLMGVLIVFGNRRGGTLGQNLNRQMWIWAIIGLLIGEAVPQINNIGHIGGFIGGLVLGYLFPKQEGVHENAYIHWTAMLLIAITMVGFGLSFWKMWPLVTT